MPRFFLSPEQWNSPFSLRGDEAKHAAQVLRLSVGDEMEVFDGQGNFARATIDAISKSCVTAHWHEAHVHPLPSPEITLAVAIPKGKNWELVLQKATELGVAAIQPLVTQRTIAQPDREKCEKWQRIALEACKQCGLNYVPRVAAAEKFTSWLAQHQADLPLLCSLTDEAKILRDVVRGASPKPRKITVLIGPEGDFTEQETQAAVAAGFRAISLGATVLRVETAVFYALSALRYEFDGTGGEGEISA